MKGKLLEGEFSSRGTLRGGLLLLAPADALALINRAADEGVPILGVDGFRITQTTTESPLEHLADFSSAVSEGHGCWQQAEAFVRARSEHGLLFEVSLGDDPIEAV